VDNTEILGMMLLSGAGSILLAVLWGRRFLRRDLAESSARRAVRVVVAAGLVGLAALIVAVQGADRFPAAILALAVAVVVFAVMGLAVAHVVRPDNDQPWSAPAAVIGLATLAALVSWFFLAPDPRFSIGALWLCAAVPAAAALSSVWTHARTAAAVMLVLLLALASAYPGRGLMKEQDLSPTRADPSQPLGLSKPPTTETGTFERDGVIFRRPVLSDTCWAESLPCTPNIKHWRLRHAGSLQDGFVDTRPRNHRGGSGD
jgi:hypothetical protein